MLLKEVSGRRVESIQVKYISMHAGASPSYVIQFGSRANKGTKISEEKWHENHEKSSHVRLD